jgi:hypothetical protein
LLIDEEIGYDVITYAGEEPNFKEIHAHSNILSIRSQYFRTAFSNEWAEKKDGKFILKKPNITPESLNIILRLVMYNIQIYYAHGIHNIFFNYFDYNIFRFIYCGNIELQNLQGPDVLKLLIAVDELNIQPLISHIQEYLIENQTEFLRQNTTRILETVHHQNLYRFVEFLS